MVVQKKRERERKRERGRQRQRQRALSGAHLSVATPFVVATRTVLLLGIDKKSCCPVLACYGMNILQ